MKCNHSCPGFELVSPCPFPTMITNTPRAPQYPGRWYNNTEKTLILCLWLKGCIFIGHVPNDCHCTCLSIKPLSYKWVAFYFEISCICIFFSFRYSVLERPLDAFIIILNINSYENVILLYWWNKFKNNWQCFVKDNQNMSQISVTKHWN